MFLCAPTLRHDLCQGVRSGSLAAAICGAYPGIHALAGPAFPNIERDEANRDDRGEYCDSQRQINMLFGVAPDGQDCGQGLEPDFTHVARRSDR
jgi:hypothetical protein